MLLKGNSLWNHKNDHYRHTWQIAYTIEGVRDWLFTQVKEAPKS
jgi:predicted peptidase